MPRFPNNGLTLVSLFAGCGGSSLGYKMAGYDIRLAAEWDIKATDTYQQNFPTTSIYKEDICKLSDRKALQLSDLESGILDVLDGSPPCQGFSMAGKRKFADFRNRLFEEYIRLLSTFQPRAFVMENVSGLIKGKMKIVFAEMTSALKAAGYQVSCRLLNSWWYGVPQNRQRLIWIGIRKDLEVIPSHPLPVRNRPLTVAEAFSMEHLPPITAFESPRSGNKENVRFVSAKLAPTLSAGRKIRIGPHIGMIEKSAARGLRYLSIKEAKILHGFPDWFQVSKYRLIGNSVPPPMAEAIGRHVAGLLTQQHDLMNSMTS